MIGEVYRTGMREGDKCRHRAVHSEMKVGKKYGKSEQRQHRLNMDINFIYLAPNNLHIS